MSNWIRRPFDKIRNWRWARALRQGIAKWWRDLDAVPYVTVYDVPATYTLPDASVSDIKGLLVVALEKSATDRRVTAYWKNRDSYLGCGNTLLINFALGAGLVPSWEGFQIGAKAPPGPNWLKRNWATLVAFLAGAAAVIGHFEKVRDCVGSLLPAPAVVVIAERAEIDVLANDEFDLECTLRNTSEWVPSRIDFKSVKTDPPTLVALEGAVPGPFLGLKPGADEKFKLHGVAYGESTDGQASAEQTPHVAFKFDGTASTWTRSSAVAARPIQLRIWPRRTVGEKRRGKVDLQGKRCQVVFEFMVGDELANGFDARAMLAPSNDVRFEYLQFPGYPRLEHPAEDTDQVAVGTWSSPAVTARKRYRFVLYLESSQTHSEQEWDKVVRDIEIKFGSRKPSK